MHTEDRVAVVTGANRGIGKSIVKYLCEEFDGDVFLTARDEKKGLEAVSELQKMGYKPKFHLLDIETSASIEKMRDLLQACYGGVDILVNNAAISFKNSSPEPFGNQAETSIRVNFFGTLAVCDAFYPILKKHARIVNISNGNLMAVNGQEPEASYLRDKLGSERLTELELVNIMNEFVRLSKDGQHEYAGFPTDAYAMSKIGISALTRIHQRYFDDERPKEDLVINAVHPGDDPDYPEAPVHSALLPFECSSPRGAYLWHDKTIVDWTQPIPDYLKD